MVRSFWLDRPPCHPPRDAGALEDSATRCALPYGFPRRMTTRSCKTNYKSCIPLPSETNLRNMLESCDHCVVFYAGEVRVSRKLLRGINACCRNQFKAMSLTTRDLYGTSVHLTGSRRQQVLQGPKALLRHALPGLLLSFVDHVRYKCTRMAWPILTPFEYEALS